MHLVLCLETMATGCVCPLMCKGVGHEAEHLTRREWVVVVGSGESWRVCMTAYDRLALLLSVTPGQPGQTFPPTMRGVQGCPDAQSSATPLTLGP